MSNIGKNKSAQGGGGGNVLINGRTAVHAGSGGMLTTVDICNTQIGPAVVPIPYTNVAQSSDAAGTAATVFINGHPVCTKSSCFSKSTGDEAGDKGGISSGTIQGKAEFLSASPNVFIEGVAAVRQGDLMVSNNQNTAPAPLMQPGAPPPSQVLQTAQEAKAPSQEPCRVALEIAGDRLDQLKGEVIAKKEGEVFKCVPLGRRSEVEGHRREVFLEGIPEGEYDLVLHQLDEPHKAYQIPLAQGVPTCPKEEESSQWETVYIPVLPRTYRTPEHDRTKAGYLRHSEDTGWVYVFVNGRLWRELKVEKTGYFRDVNLTYEKGRDQRPATISTSDNRILVPYTIQGEAVELEMAYSEVQWSWARIDAMGGMAGDDPRQVHGGTVPPGDDSEEAANLRSRRMQKIDLSSYPDFDQDEGVIGTADQFEPPLRFDLATHRESKIPVVYLHDPLGVAMNLADTHEAAWAEMETFIESLRTGIAPKELERQRRTGQGDAPLSAEEQKRREQIEAQFRVAVLMQQIGFASEENRKKYGRHLNQDCLKTLLGADQRREIRQKIKNTRDKLARFLDQEGYQDALEDYLHNIPLRLLNGKAAVLYGCHFLARPETALDKALDPPDLAPPDANNVAHGCHFSAPDPAPSFSTAPPLDAAADYMDKVRVGMNVAGKILAETVEISSEEERRMRSSASPESEELLQDMQAPKSLQLKEVIEKNSLSLASKAGVIGSNMLEAFTSLEADTRTLEWAAERINTLRVPGFGEYRVVDLFVEPDIPDGYHLDPDGRSYSLQRHTTASGALIASTGGVAYYGSGENTVTAVSRNQLKILPVTIERSERIVRQIVRSDFKPLRKRFADLYLKSHARAFGVRPFFVALDMLNLRSAFQQLAAGGARGFGGAALLTSAVAGVIEGMAETSNLILEKVTQKGASARLRRIALGGKVIGNVAAGFYEGFAALRAFQEKDTDSAFAHSVSAGAFVGLAFATTWWVSVPLLLIAMGASIAAVYLKNDPLERFADNGPLSLPPSPEGTLWEQIRDHAANPPMDEDFRREWPNWQQIEAVVKDDYLLPIAGQLEVLTEEYQPRRDFNSDGTISWWEKELSSTLDNLMPLERFTGLEAKFNLSHFSVLQSHFELHCHCYPKGLEGPMFSLDTREFVNETDEETGSVKSIGLVFTLSEEQQRLLTSEVTFLLLCRKSDGKTCRPFAAADGTARYFALRGPVVAKETTTEKSFLAVGTMEELSSKTFWES